MIKKRNNHIFHNPKSVVLVFTVVSLLLASVITVAMPFFTNLVAGSDTSTIRRPDSYGKPNQSRIWFNSHQNRWDALIPRNDGGISASDHYIMQDVLGGQQFDLSTELEDRDFGRSDVFWDDGNKQLYVLSSHPTQSQFWRVGFTELSDNYSIEVGTAGTGEEIPGITHPATSGGGNSPATLYVSPNEDIWVSVMKDNQLLIQHSVDGGVTWLASPINLDSTARLGVTTWNQFENNGTTFIGVFAGENGENNVSTDFSFHYINQDDDPAILSNWIDDSANIPAPFGDEQGDDHVSSGRDADNNLYFAVKTEGGNSSDPLIKLYKRTPSGTWSQFKVTDTQETPEESRPSIVIDGENEELYIFTNGAEIVSPDEREGSYVSAPLNSLEDLANTSFTRIFSVANIIFTDLITPRLIADANTDIVVLAHNRTDDTVWYSQVEIDTAVILVPAPDVVGLTRFSATRAINNAGLTVGNISRIYSNTVRRGRVISQNPDADTSVAPGSAINLVISLGPLPDDDDDDDDDDGDDDD